MSVIKNYKRDPEDVHTLLMVVEKSFDIKFEENELKDVKNFGELSDIILSKINLPSVNDSTHQQAFYKIRLALSEITGIDKKDLLPETKLNELFPRKGRKKKIREMEFILGISLKVLRPFIIIELFLMLSFIGTIVFLFINFSWGIILLALWIVLNSIAFKTGIEFNCETVEDLVKKFTKENYKKARRNPETINEKEVIQQLKLIFSEGYLREGEEMNRETEFYSN